jgi:peptide deformylase
MYKKKFKILKIVLGPSDILSTKVPDVEVSEIATLRKSVDNMFATMYHANGIGLAAVQVAIMKRFFIMDLQNEDAEPMVFFNPVIVQHCIKTTPFEEGCLSFPGQHVVINRYDEITLEYLDLTAVRQKIRLTGLASICAQHEIDHLDGKIMLDHIDTAEQLQSEYNIAKQYRNNLLSNKTDKEKYQ